MDQATLIVSLSACIVAFAVAALILSAWSLHQTAAVLNQNHNILWQKLMLIVVKQFASEDPASARQAIEEIARHGVAGVDMRSFNRSAQQVRAAREAEARAEAAFQKEQTAQIEKNRQNRKHRVVAGFMPTLDEQDPNTESQETNNHERASH